MEAANLAEPSSSTSAEDLESYYASDNFRMTAMKVLPCSKRYVHDWTECPLAHPQEKARRRDPRTHQYTGIACPSMKKDGNCAFGDHCPYAHNVFEYWLHPTRYRTQLCNDGSNCRRKICFFAHGLDELRVPACKPFVSPEALAAAAAAAAADAEAKRRSGVVGSPVANLAMPVRLSTDSVRQSSEWGPVPLPAAERLSRDSSSGDEQQQAPASPRQPPSQQPYMQQEAPGGFSSQEEHVIETVTAMLAQDKVTPTQAATILQQMLPAASLQLLQSRLGVPTGTTSIPRVHGDPSAVGRPPGGLFADSRRFSDSSADRGPEAVKVTSGQGFGPSLEQLAAMQAAQAVHGGSAYGPASPHGGADSGARRSFDSARSSQDTLRMSLEGSRRSASFDGSRASTDFVTPCCSGDYTPAAPLPPAPVQYSLPAPAYPQGGQAAADAPDASHQPRPPPGGASSGKQRYWTRQQLSTVPEGVAMVSVPPPSNPWGRRNSTSSMDSAAERLSTDFGRMSVEAPGAERSVWSAPQLVDPYASAFFGGSSAACGTAGGDATSAAAAWAHQQHAQNGQVNGWHQQQQ